MRKDAVPLEEDRLKNVDTLVDYKFIHERHRIFPQVFEDRNHEKILELAAGVGCTAHRIKEHYSGKIICNDLTPTALRVLKETGLDAVCFDIDDSVFPYPDECFDAVISLATIEHLIFTDQFLREINRVLKKDGYLYISSPNYASLIFIPRYLFDGRSFHDPISDSERTRYEFYSHVRYFTYITLLEYVNSFNFQPEAVYLPLPKGSSFYQSLYLGSKTKAFAYRSFMWFLYSFFSPRWASEPVLCFQKSQDLKKNKPRKIVI